jgi:hypothetical protein
MHHLTGQSDTRDRSRDNALGTTQLHRGRIKMWRKRFGSFRCLRREPNSSFSFPSFSLFKKMASLVVNHITLSVTPRPFYGISSLSLTALLPRQSGFGTKA